MAWYYAYYARTLFLFWRRKYVKATSVVISDGGSFSKTLGKYVKATSISQTEVVSRRHWFVMLVGI